MAEMTMQGPRGPAALNPLALRWKQLSPRLVPVMALVTALIIGMLFMMLLTFIRTGSVDIGAELNKTGTAYSALLEGSVGVVINNVLTADGFTEARQFLASGTFGTRDLNRAARSANEAAQIGLANLRQFQIVLAAYPGLTDEQITAFGETVPEVAQIGEERFQSIIPLIEALNRLDRAAATGLVESVVGPGRVTAEARAALEAAIPEAADYTDADLLTDLRIIDTEGVVRAGRLAASYGELAALGLSVTSAEGQALGAMGRADITQVRPAIEFTATLDELGIADPAALATQLRLVRDLYDEGLFTAENAGDALANELPGVLSANQIILRPNNQLFLSRSSDATGVIMGGAQTPDDPVDDRPEAVFVRLGDRALIFLPANFENWLTRTIPFVIAGLAVALGFKAGVFNIGAEGQLYAGGTLAAWVGFSPLFSGLPALIHIPMVIVAGIVGGLLWGAIPGLLKAFTGAHEVINTIMLNFIAILLVDWLIKSENPVIIGDPTATTPRTPFIAEGATLPTFDSIPLGLMILAGVLLALWGWWSNRERIAKNPALALRPVLNGLVVVVGGVFLAWTSVRGALHIGLLIMIAAVWLTDWFLERTTPGFELRTVGANPDAAKYAGMNVRLNVVLALALGGALAGLAGAIEVSGVQFNMQPFFFGGIGFDAIAVALLARSDPRAMIPAGLLWGALLAGAGLMQTRANISIDLVKIIQALIIMFIAADAIIRYLWRVPEATDDEKQAALFASKGWGG
jgi:simple sugar transport system permease protein